jgi:dTMP kinase
VICDRFVDSSIAYQGIAGGLGARDVRAINAPIIGSSWPDLTLLLRTDPSIGARRASARDGEETDRFSERDDVFHKTVADAFDTLAEAEPDRFSVIDASGGIDSVAQAIQSVVQERLL